MTKAILKFCCRTGLVRLLPWWASVEKTFYFSGCMTVSFVSANGHCWLLLFVCLFTLSLSISFILSLLLSLFVCLHWTDEQFIIFWRYFLSLGIQSETKISKLKYEKLLSIQNKIVPIGALNKVDADGYWLQESFIFVLGIVL